MINELILNYIIIFVALEMYEISWQKAPTMMGMITRMNKYYKNNIILFLLMQPTFYFAIYLAMISNFNPYAMFFLFIKTVDVATKIILIEQVFVKKEISNELSVTLLTPINAFFPYLGLVTYPFLIALSF